MLVFGCVWDAEWVLCWEGDWRVVVVMRVGDEGGAVWCAAGAGAGGGGGRCVRAEEVGGRLLHHSHTDQTTRTHSSHISTLFLVVVLSVSLSTLCSKKHMVKKFHCNVDSVLSLSPFLYPQIFLTFSVSSLRTDLAPC